MRRIALCAVLLTLVVSTGSFAKNGLYVGGSVGQGYVDLNTGTDIKLDDEDFAYKLFVGFRPAGFFAVEGGYRDFGQVQNGSGMDVTTSETSAFDAEGLGILKLGIVDIFGKVGLVIWDTDVSFDNVEVPSLSDSDTSAIYGIGLGVRIGGLGLRLEYEVLDVKTLDDLEMVSLGVSWTF